MAAAEAGGWSCDPLRLLKRLRHSLPGQISVGLALTCSLLAPSPARALSPTGVNVFVGSLGGGNTTPAAAVPFGFAQAGPDTIKAPSSGYAPGQPLLGFSQTHLSGTGGAGKYGNFRVTPSLGAMPTTLDSEAGLPGSYGARLDGGRITARLTATRMGAVHRYVFPATRQARVTIDPGSVIDTGRLAQRVLRSSLRVTGPRTVEGGGTFSGGWNPGSYTLWFAARFDRAPRARLAHGDTWVFDTRGRRAVELSIGLSFRSPAAARRNIPHGGFARTRRAAQATWGRALGRIAITGGSPEQRGVFATRALPLAADAPRPHGRQRLVALQRAAL